MKWFGNINKNELIVKYAALASGLIFNGLVYWGCMYLSLNRYHYDFTTAFDNMVPFIPAFAVPYLLSYVYWLANYIIVGSGSRKEVYRFVTADWLSRIICAVFFIVMPTTNIRPEVTGTTFFDDLMRLIYTMDEPVNLFPSIHCLVSILCVFGIWKRKNVPVWYKWASVISTVLICLSTQFTKQHYYVDFFGGLIVAIVVWWIAQKTNAYKVAESVFEKIYMALQKRSDRSQRAEKD